MTTLSAIQKNNLYLTKNFFLPQEYLWSLVSLHAKFEEPQATLSRQERDLKTDTHLGEKNCTASAQSIDTHIRVSIARTAQVIKKPLFSYNAIIEVLLEMAQHKHMQLSNGWGPGSVLCTILTSKVCTITRCQ